MPLTPEIIKIIRVAVDERYGEGTSEMVDAQIMGQPSQEAIAERFGLSGPTISRRIKKARAFALALITGAGLGAG